MRFCPLANVQIPCSEVAPLCPWCELSQRSAPAAERDVTPASASKPGKVCIDCHEAFQPTSNRQQRCAACGAEHDRIENRRFQKEFRQRKAKNNVQTTT